MTVLVQHAVAGLRAGVLHPARLALPAGYTEHAWPAGVASGA